MTFCSPSLQISSIPPFHSRFRAKLLVWRRCAAKPRGRSRGGSDFAGTKTGPVKPRSLVKPRKCFSLQNPFHCSLYTWLPVKSTSFTTHRGKRPSTTWLILQESPRQRETRLPFVSSVKFSDLECFYFAVGGFFSTSQPSWPDCPVWLMWVWVANKF